MLDRCLRPPRVRSPPILAGCAGRERSNRSDRGESEPGLDARPARHPRNPEEALTLDAIYDPPEKRVDFNGNPPSNLVWIDDAHLFGRSRSEGEVEAGGVAAPEADTGKTGPSRPSRRSRPRSRGARDRRRDGEEARAHEP
jgi:hypothetical protein